MPGTTPSVKTQGTARSFKRNLDSADPSSVAVQHLSYLGDGSNAIPSFPEIDFTTQLPEDCAYEDVDTLRYGFWVLEGVKSELWVFSKVNLSRTPRSFPGRHLEFRVWYG